MNYDYGFELSDTRHTFFTEGKQPVSVVIVRHWYQMENDETNFKVSFNIVCGDVTTSLPVGTREEQAIGIAHQLYEEDEEFTRANDEIEAEYAAERRMGA